MKKLVLVAVFAVLTAAIFGGTAMAIASADLRLDLATSNQHPNTGDTVTVRARVTNFGPSGATNLVMTIQADDYDNIAAVSVPAGWTCTVGGHTITCEAPSLAAGARTGIFTFTMVATDPGPDSRALIYGNLDSDEFDPKPANNTNIYAASTIP